MANTATLNAETKASLVAQSSKLVGEVYNAMLWKESSNKDVFGQFEGPEGSGKPIHVKTDLSKGKADKVNFATIGRLDGEGVRSDAALRGNEEIPKMNSWYVQVDQIRHAVAWTALVQHMNVTGKNLEDTYEDLITDWFGRKKQDDLQMSMIANATDWNTVRPNNTGSYDTLTKADVINVGTISNAAIKLSAIGGEPAKITKSIAGADIDQFLLFGGAQGLNPLKTNSSYLAAAENAQMRGTANTLFAGGYTNWDGTGIFHWNVKDSSGRNIAAPVEPRARLGDPISAGTTALTVTGGNVASPGTYYRPFRFFRGYAYQGIGEAAPSADSGTRYFIVYNVTGADAGKFGVYSYVGSDNLGYQITTTNRLGSAASGTRVTTLAGQAWNATYHTDAHPTGSYVIQVNALCTSVARFFMLGDGGMGRAYGTVPMATIRQVDDYGEYNGLGVKSIYGQAPRKDSGGVVAGYVLIEAAYTPVGLDLDGIV